MHGFWGARVCLSWPACPSSSCIRSMPPPPLPGPSHPSLVAWCATGMCVCVQAALLAPPLWPGVLPACMCVCAGGPSHPSLVAWCCTGMRVCVQAAAAAKPRADAKRKPRGKKVTSSSEDDSDGGHSVEESDDDDAFVMEAPSPAVAPKVGCQDGRGGGSTWRECQGPLPPAAVVVAPPYSPAAPP